MSSIQSHYCSEMSCSFSFSLISLLSLVSDDATELDSVVIAGDAIDGLLDNGCSWIVLGDAAMPTGEGDAGAVDGRAVRSLPESGDSVVLPSKICTCPFSTSRSASLSGNSIGRNLLDFGVDQGPMSQLGRPVLKPPLPRLPSSPEVRWLSCDWAWLAADSALARLFARMIVPMAPNVPRRESMPGSSVFCTISCVDEMSSKSISSGSGSSSPVMWGGRWTWGAELLPGLRGPDDVRERTSDRREGRERRVLVRYTLALRAAKGSISCLAASSNRVVCPSTCSRVNHRCLVMKTSNSPV